MTTVSALRSRAVACVLTVALAAAPIGAGAASAADATGVDDTTSAESSAAAGDAAEQGSEPVGTRTGKGASQSTRAEPKAAKRPVAPKTVTGGPAQPQESASGTPGTDPTPSATASPASPAPSTTSGPTTTPSPTRSPQPTQVPSPTPSTTKPTRSPEPTRPHPGPNPTGSMPMPKPAPGEVKPSHPGRAERDPSNGSGGSGASYSEAGGDDWAPSSESSGERAAGDYSDPVPRAPGGEGNDDAINSGAQSSQAAPTQTADPNADADDAGNSFAEGFSWPIAVVFGIIALALGIAVFVLGRRRGGSGRRNSH